MSARFEPLVLCYHAVSDDWDQTLSVRPSDLARQLRFVLARRYRPVRAEDVVAGRGRVFHVTFDDAFRSVATAVPLLERLGIPATVFACTGYAADGRPLDISPKLAGEARRHPEQLASLDWDGLRALAERGVAVGSHTITHPHLPQLSDRELAIELRDSREHVESELRAPCRFLAFPFGDHDPRVRAAAERAGYEAAFALPGRSKPVDRFALPRVGIWRKDGVVRAAVKTSPVRYPVGALLGWR